MTFSPLSVLCASVVNGNGRARRFAYYFASLFLGICIFALPLKDLIAMSLQSELYSYIPLIFVVSCYLLASGRKEIFDNPAWSFGYGPPVLILSLAAGVAGLKYAVLLGPNDGLCVMAFSFWLFLMGTFILFFGTRTLMKAIFPLALLLLTIPFPGLLLDKIVTFLQATSFTATGLIFNVLGFFPLEQGFRIQVPGRINRGGQAVQRDTFQHCARYHESFVRSYFFEVEPQSNSPGNVRGSDRHLQKRGANRRPDAWGHVRGPEDTVQPLAPEWRYPGFYPGLWLALDHYPGDEKAGEEKSSEQ